MADFFDSSPIETPLPDPEPEAGNGGIQIKTSNTNLGGLKVAVPRHFGRVMQAIDQQAQVFGHRWLYSMPFKKKLKDGREITQLVEGPTVGCALDVARAYGNCTVDCERIEEVGDGWVFHAVFLDIETGFRLGRPFRQRKQQNIGGMGGDKGRSEDIIFQIGASKAIRNVVVNSLRGIVDEALARGAARLTEKIEKNRDFWLSNMRERLDELGVPEKRVAAYYQSPLEELKATDLASIAKQLTAIRDDMMTADQLCPIADQPAPKADTGDTDGDKKTRKRISLVFRGKPLFKSRFLTDVTHHIKSCDSLSGLGELQAEITLAIATCDDESSKPELTDKFGTMIDKKFKALAPADAEDESMPDHDEKTGEVLVEGEDEQPDNDTFDLTQSEDLA